MNKFAKACLSVTLAVMLSSSGRAADIVDTAVSNGKFKTLASALGAANLVSTLKGPGPFTVFAPTDEAFAKLPPGTVQTLLKPENRATLSGILTYHVVPGRVPASSVVNLRGSATVNGQHVEIRSEGSNVMIDGATVVTTDIQCDNGIIHVIDSVILPSDKTIPELATEAGAFQTLLAAATAAGLADTLGTSGPFTVFAPTDEAFAKLPEGTVASLLKPENKQQLVDLLKYHVVSGRIYAADAVAAKSAGTLLGRKVNVSVSGSGAYVNQSKLVSTDLDASNGVVHVIDSVLSPPPAPIAPARVVTASRPVVTHSVPMSHQVVDPHWTLTNAVQEGVPLFNAGHHAACAQVYQRALENVMPTMSNMSMKHHIQTVLTTARGQHNVTTRAWTLRHGIDQMVVQLRR